MHALGLGGHAAGEPGGRPAELVGPLVTLSPLGVGGVGGAQGLFLLLWLLQAKGSGPDQLSPGSPLKSLSVSSAHLLPRLPGSI